MTVVIDANVLVVLALDRERGPAIDRRLRAWRDAGHDLHAPMLLRYEVASALANAVAVDQLEPDVATDAWERMIAVPIELHLLDDGPSVVAMAQQLERRSAYDAAYVVLAQSLGAELWTLDGSLVRNAAPRGLPVQLIEFDGDRDGEQQEETSSDA